MTDSLAVINYKIHNNLPVRKTKTFDNDFIQPTPTTIESSEKRLDQDSITPNSNMQTSFFILSSIFSFNKLIIISFVLFFFLTEEK